MLNKGFWLLVALAAPSAMPGWSQNLGQMYQEALFRAKAERIFEQQGMQVPHRPPVRIPTVADSIDAWSYRPPEPVVEEPPPPVFEISRLQYIPKLARSWFARQFPDVQWAFLGSNYRTVVDTTWTHEWRARLEANYGAPTATIVEVAEEDGLQPGEYLQFSYWFVLNDTIPLRITDVDGPFDRGLVVASDQKYRDILFDIRQAFSMQLLVSEARKPYVDYYFDEIEQQWYRTGYDGQRFFNEPIQRPTLGRGRPWLEPR